MIKIKRKQLDMPVTVDMELSGVSFEIELLPLPQKEWIRILEPFRKRKTVLNPSTNRMEIASFTDEDSEKYMEVTDALLDRLVRNFRGIAGENDQELDGTLKENKLLLGSVKIEDMEEIQIQDEAGDKGVIRRPRTRMLRQLIFEKATELADTTVETERKNSGTPQDGSTANAG